MEKPGNGEVGVRQAAVPWHQADRPPGGCVAITPSMTQELPFQGPETAFKPLNPVDHTDPEALDYSRKLLR
jgi:hypothetical protein